MAKTEKNEEKPKRKRAADYGGGGEQLEGERIKLVDIVGEEVLIIDFNIRASQFGEKDEQGNPKKYAVIQIEYKGEKRVIMTGAGVIVDTLQNVPREDLPIYANFDKAVGKSGRGYWTMK